MSRHLAPSLSPQSSSVAWRCRGGHDRRGHAFPARPDRRAGCKPRRLAAGSARALEQCLDLRGGAGEPAWVQVYGRWHDLPRRGRQGRHHLDRGPVRAGRAAGRTLHRWRHGPHLDDRRQRQSHHPRRGPGFEPDLRGFRQSRQRRRRCGLRGRPSLCPDRRRWLLPWAPGQAERHPQGPCRRHHRAGRRSERLGPCQPGGNAQPGRLRAG